MNCKTVQRRLLSTSEPARVPSSLWAHLTDCPACRECHQRLVQIERSMADLPVPPTNAKAELMRRLDAEAASRSWPGSLHRTLRKRRWALLGAAAAATIIATVLAWSSFSPRLPTPGPEARLPPGPDPLLVKLMERHLRLAKANTLPRDRFEALADLADDLHGRSGPLAQANDADNLQVLAELYAKVVRDGVVERARALPVPDQRSDVLEAVTRRLGRAADETNELAQEEQGDIRAALLAMAAAARQGQEELQKVVAQRPASAERLALAREERP